MEAELRKAPASYRVSMLSKVRNYKHNVEQLTADVVCCCATFHCIDLYVCHLLYYTSVSALTLLGGRKGIRPVKNGGMAEVNTG